MTGVTVKVSESLIAVSLDVGCWVDKVKPDRPGKVEPQRDAKPTDTTKPTRRPWAPGLRSLLVAAGLGATSSGILNVANDLVAVLALNAGPQQIGLLNAVESLAFLVFSVPAGWWLDRVDRRRALLWTQALATLALLSVPIAWLMGLLTFPHLVIASFFVGTAGMVWGLGLGALLPSVAGRDRAGAAFARKAAVETSASLVAPGLTGLLLMVLAAPIALFFSAFLEALAGLVLWRGGVGAARKGADGEGLAPGQAPDAAGPSNAATPPSGEAAEQPLGFAAGVAEGFRFVVGSRPILLSTINSAVLNASLAMSAAVSIVYVVRQLGFSPALVGLQGVVIGFSGLMGSILAAKLLDRFNGLKVAAVGITVAAAGSVLFPLASLHPGLGWSLPFVLGYSLLWNASIVSANSGLFGIVAALTPEGLMGRVQSFRMLVALGPLPIFGLVGGFLGERIGAVPTLWLVVGLAFVSVSITWSLWLLSRRRPWGVIVAQKSAD